MNARYCLATALTAALAFSSLACETPSSTPSQPTTPKMVEPVKTGDVAPPKNSRSAPDFALTTFNAGKFDLKENRGKVVVVNFWATWCGPCVAEMPGFNKIYKQLKGDGLEIVGLSLDQDNGEDAVKGFLAKRPIEYPIAMGSQNIAASYGIGNGIPYTVFIDRKGNISSTNTGSMSEAEFEAKVKALLAEGA